MYTTCRCTCGQNIDCVNFKDLGIVKGCRRRQYHFNGYLSPPNKLSDTTVATDNDTGTLLQHSIITIIKDGAIFGFRVMLCHDTAPIFLYPTVKGMPPKIE